MGKIILVVDDDPDVRLGMQIRLGVNDYTVINAVNGETAIAAILLYGPDLVILDLGMPLLDGFAVMGHFRGVPPPIIVISGTDPRVSRSRAIDAGAKAYLVKPVDNDLLLKTIRRVILEGAAQL